MHAHVLNLVKLTAKLIFTFDTVYYFLFSQGIAKRRKQSTKRKRNEIAREMKKSVERERRWNDLESKKSGVRKRRLSNIERKKSADRERRLNRKR